jgi:hypothetical protein
LVRTCCIRNFAANWAKAKPQTRATMIQSVYEEAVVRGEEFVRVRLHRRRMRTVSRLPCPTRSLLPPSRPGEDRGLVKYGIGAPDRS